MPNINDEIKVKLTAHGKDILDKDVEDTLSTIKTLISDKTYYPYHVDKDGYIEFQLWDFMRIFGPHFWNGCPQIIENNEIIFTPEITQAYALKLFDTWNEYADNCLKEHSQIFNEPVVIPADKGMCYNCQYKTDSCQEGLHCIRDSEG